MKYNIDKDFRLIAKFKAPSIKYLFPVSNLFVSLLPKELNDKKFVSKKIRLEYCNMYYISPKELVNKVTPCLIYFHGGGFVYKAVTSHYKNLKDYAISANCKVFAVDYRLAPKYPYPIPVEDCLEAYKNVIDNASEYKVDKNKIILGGDSAGGSLTLDTYLTSKKIGFDDPKGLFLIFPVVDNEMTTESMKKFVDTPLWDSKNNKKMWNWYLRDREYISPLKRTDEMTVPNVFIEVEEFDCLHDEGEELYKKLKDKVNTTFLDLTGTIHGYDVVRNSPITQMAFAKRIKFLNDSFEN